MRSTGRIDRDQTTESQARTFKQQTVAMGRPRVDLDKALALAARLEDEEVVRRLVVDE